VRSCAATYPMHHRACCSRRHSCRHRHRHRHLSTPSSPTCPLAVRVRRAAVASRGYHRARVMTPRARPGLGPRPRRSRDWKLSGSGCRGRPPAGPFLPCSSACCGHWRRVGRNRCCCCYPLQWERTAEEESSLHLHHQSCVGKVPKARRRRQRSRGGCCAHCHAHTHTRARAHVRI
jgi:hypothetical protein